MLFTPPIFERKNIFKNLQVLFLLLIIITLPFKYIYNSISIIAFVIAWLLTGNLKEKLYAIYNNKTVLLFTVFYFFSLITLFYSSNLKEGLFDAQLKISLFVFPLVVSSSPQFFQKENFFRLLKLFLFAVFAACIICHVHIVLNLLNAGRTFSDLFSAAYSSAELTSYINIHPVYLSMYVCFAASVVGYLLLFRNENFKISEKIVHIVLWIYFTVFVFQSSARIVIIAHILVCMILFFLYLKKKKNSFVRFSVISGIVIISFFFIFQNSFLWERFANILKPFSKETSQWNSNTTSPRRFIIWNSAADVIKENILFGVGIGDVHTELNKIYVKNGFKLGEYFNYNSHNQFIETFVSMGVIGGAIFIFIFLYSFYIAFKTKSYLYLFFLILVFVCCLTENILNTQRGVVFYSLFNSLLALGAKQQKISL